MWPGGDMTGFWVLSLVSGVLGLVITIGLIVLIVLGIRWLLRQERTSQPRAGAAEEDALAVLRRRYAAGEIDDDEFDRRRRALGG